MISVPATQITTKRYLICKSVYEQFGFDAGEHFAVDTHAKAKDGQLVLADIAGDTEIAIYHYDYIEMADHRRAWIFEILGSIVDT